MTSVIPVILNVSHLPSVQEMCAMLKHWLAMKNNCKGKE